MEPIPESAEALQELAEYGESDLAVTLRTIATRVTALVPACVGVSLTLVNDELTLTMVATDEDIALSDAVQYVDGGPCEDSATSGEVVEFRTEDVLDERRWSMFARATAASGVRSTLSLPVLGPGGEAVAGVNLYGATADAFDGHHEALARICSAWHPGVVTNADLEFRTRSAAAQAPGRIRDQHAIEAATGALMGARGFSLDEAESVLEDAARRAGVRLEQAARTVLRVLGG